MHIGPPESSYTIPQRSCAATAIEMLKEYGEIEEKELFEKIYGTEEKSNNNGHKQNRTFFWTMKMLEEDGIVSKRSYGKDKKRKIKYELSRGAKNELRAKRTRTRLECIRAFNI